MNQHMSSQGLELALTVSPRMVSTVRRFVDLVAEQMGVGADISRRVALTVHELFENVAKYGQQRRGVLRLDVETEGRQHKLLVTVKNYTSRSQVDRLQQVFQAMETGPDALTYYFTLLRRQDQSGLGLARIRAEGEMQLSLAVSGEEVSICATSEPFSPSEEIQR